MTRFVIIKLAPDHAAYRADAGKPIVTGEDLGPKNSCPMSEPDARMLASALNACQAAVDRWEHGDLAEAARLRAAAVEDANRTTDRSEAPKERCHA